MAAEITVKIDVEITGLGSETGLSTKFTHSVTPTEVAKGYVVVGTSAMDLPLGGITDTAVTGVLIIAKGTADTDFIGVLVNSTGTPSASAGNQVLNAGEACYINLYGGLTSGSDIRVIGAAATSAMEYWVFGA